MRAVSRWTSGFRPISWSWAATILFAWTGLALVLDQPFWSSQHSLRLVPYGALRGDDFTLGESWRLLVSQWLHVRFPHMLFNVILVGVIGSSIERRSGWVLMLAVGIIGGAAGQAAALYADPTAYVSGASQACLALCGLALLIVQPRSPSWWLSIFAVTAAAALDLFVSDHASIKVGHLVGFACGISVGIIVMRSRRACCGAA